MALLLFICPKTNQQAATGIETDVQSLSASWRATLKVNCPHCGEAHEISVRETYTNGALRDATDSLGRGATMITANPRPMSSAPLDGTPVRLFVSAGSAIASFWSAERCRKAFGAGDYRAGWYLLDDDTIELHGSMGWEPLPYLRLLR